MRLTVWGGEASPSFSQTSKKLWASPECMVWNVQFPSNISVSILPV